MPEPRPPRWADYLLEKLVNPRFVEDIQRNLEGIFARSIDESDAIAEIRVISTVKSE